MAQKKTDRIGEQFKAISGDLKLYIEKRLELLLLNIGEQISKWLAASIQKISGVILLVGGLVCLLVALAIFLGNLLGNDSLGYLIVSVPLLVLGYLLINLKPDSVLKSLQQHFESELIESIDLPEKKQALSEAFEMDKKEGK